MGKYKMTFREKIMNVGYWIIERPYYIREWWRENKDAFPLIFKKGRVQFREYFDKKFWTDYIFQEKHHPFNFLNLICRLKGHPGGSTVYSNGGDDYEPHESCDTCGEDFY